MKGEAFFEVTENMDKHFIVSMPQGERIEVLGTKFNVEAYDNDCITTTLVEGEVKFKYCDNGQVKFVSMKPNQRLVYNLNTSKTELFATNCFVETSWKDGKIHLNNTKFEDVLKMLEKRFNIEFTVKNKKYNDFSFTGTFTSQRVERIMEYFKISSGIQWRYIDNKDIKEKKQQIELY